MDSPFAKLKVVELKEQLSAKGLSTKGLKKDLVERLEQAMNASEHIENNESSMVEIGEIKSDIHVDSIAEGNDVYDAVDSLVPIEQPYTLDKNESIELDYDEPSQPIKVEPKVNEEPNPQPPGITQIGAKFDSSIVKISNLVRPFSLDELQSLLGKYGLVITFWIDRLRTVAFAEFDSVEAAELCKFQLDGLTWPQGIGKQLVVEPSDVDSMNAAMNAPVVPIVDHQSTHKALISPPVLVSNNLLDQLFCKTKCLPHLYYLPKNKQ